MIKASCHTADEALAVEFDATPWFQEADPQSILHLARAGWSSAWVAEMLEAQPGYETLHQLLDYAASRLRQESLEDITWESFECRVDEKAARDWLSVHRPEVAAFVRDHAAVASSATRPRS